MRKIYFYNTLTKKKEEFTPLSGNRVGMYVCGITPYDFTHLGHGRCYVAFDTVRRFLKYCGYDVKYVQNFTDIDDKIIERSRASGTEWKELSGKFIDAYYEDARKLGIEDANAAPRVSGHIPDIIEAVKKLVEKGFAYELDGSVYYRVSKFDNYGKLSGRNKDELKPGARIEIDTKKESPLDFALWKRSLDTEPGWDSPWGMGRPGWHIECSVMSMKYIGATLDIHAGGGDLIFPHHENEIAQSEALSGRPFCRFWLHNGFVTINKEKMSKSLNNFFTLKEIFEKFSPQTVRFFLLSQHYRAPVDFSEEALAESERALERINRAFGEKPKGPGSEEEKKQASGIMEKFLSALADDLNTSAAFSRVFALVREFNRTGSSVFLEKLEEADKILNILHLDRNEKKLPMTEAEIEKKIKERDAARASKDYARADAIRKELEEKGITIEDSPSGARWRLK